MNILENLEGSTKLTDNLTFSDTQISLASWIVMPTYAQENEANVKRFLRALYKGMDFGADAANQETVAQYVADQTKSELQTALDQTGDAQWLTGEEVKAGAADGTIEGYYALQRDNFLANDEAVTEENALPVAEYVLLDLMANPE